MIGILQAGRWGSAGGGVGLLCLMALIVPLCAQTADGPQASLPETVGFDNAGQHLIGYLFRPRALEAGRTPAIVLMHGRAGPYSTLAHGVYDATTLSKRHLFWGRFWAEQGYVALLVDSFSTRGFPGGFPIHSYDQRPEAVNEVTVRPLDAYAALAWLKARPDVDPGRIALQGWSNGGSAALATMADVTLDSVGLRAKDGFRGALAFYPACGLHGRFEDRYRPYAAVRVFSGEDDEEVSARQCKALVDASAAAGGDIAIVTYPGATHDFDDPGRRRQGVPENVVAARDAIARAAAFIRAILRP